MGTRQGMYRVLAGLGVCVLGRLVFALVGQLIINR